MTNVAVLGASGYGGGELLRLLSGHPEVRIAIATSRTYAGKPVHSAFPSMAKRLDLTFTETASPEALATCPIVFLARDNGVAMREAPSLLEAGCKAIDLSADFRFRDTATYERFYKGPHAAPELTRGAVYGLPELHRADIRKARIVGNPGCYTTAAILGLAPLLALDRADPLVDRASIIVDAKSGASGSGRSRFGLATHFSEANENARAYNIAGAHRHTPEIEQELAEVAGGPIAITFTPHVVPMTRGIIATCYATLTRAVSTDDLLATYQASFADEPFVYATDGMPETKHTLGSNMLHIGLRVDARVKRVTVVSCLDNLGKGMAGQAVQNMNLLCGFAETAGLEASGLWP
ncbi:MAG: N-acetyl-gamma-glutamyl-phosphate reductase [Armatimonadetes bacterium]|nr:N-acetyl-gamma-glutamyl-phosphate reductase [Armatimonadota bacterium]